VRGIKNGRSDFIARVGELVKGTCSEGHFPGFFGADVLLVPAPRSVPFITNDALWPAMRICQEMLARGVCRDVQGLLVRHTPVPKSAFLRQGKDRPDPDEHVRTIRVDSPFGVACRRIVIVDDVVTRGSTLLGCARVLAAVFPEAEIQAFAAVRTVSDDDVDRVLHPLIGSIFMQSGRPRRDP
jgi:hypothetical protein